MFTKIWKRTAEAEAAEEFEFTVQRQNRDPLRFNGQLQFESLGDQLTGYSPGDPYHTMRIYKMSSAGYAVIVEFHRDQTATFVEAATVDTVADVDDFFCLHAGDYFHHMVLDPDGETEQDKQVEQRVLKCYDRQLLDVSKHLSQYAPGVGLL